MAYGLRWKLGRLGISVDRFARELKMERRRVNNWVNGTAIMPESVHEKVFGTISRLEREKREGSISNGQ